MDVTKIMFGKTQAPNPSDFTREELFHLLAWARTTHSTLQTAFNNGGGVPREQLRTLLASAKVSPHFYGGPA